MDRNIGDIIGYTDAGVPAVNMKSVKEYVEQGPIDVVSVSKKSDEINIFGLSDGTYITKNMAVTLADKGLLNGCITSTSKLGEKYIKNSPDGDPSNNLQNLPRIE